MPLPSRSPSASHAARAALTLAATGALVVAGAVTADASTADRTLDGSVAPWATASHKVAATTSGSVTFRVYLNLSSDAAKTALAVSTPGSGSYKAFLTPAQFHSRFSPKQGDLDAVKTWLKGKGFSVGYAPDSRRYVEATGTLQQAASAFSTSFATYKVAGRTLRANTSPLHVPATLGSVQSVIGLDESAALVKSHASPPAAFVNAPPCSAYWGEKTVANTATPDGTKLPATPSVFAPCGYAGAQLQGAYGMRDAIASGNDGRGVTVAVIDAYASPTAAKDLQTYSSKHGLPSVSGHFREVVAPGTYNRPQNRSQDPEGWSGEETLDLEAVHTMAPGADIVYVGAPNNYSDLDAALNHVVDKHLADIVTNSYGFSTEALPKGYIKPFEDTLVQAAAEGISVFFSSGDFGDETLGVSGATPTPDWPASSPFVTAVGGTSLGVSKANTRVFELGWETGKSTLDAKGTWTPRAYTSGSGGGTSRLFAQPSYQAGIVPDSIAKVYGGAAMRAVPDVSALGDPSTGMLIGQTQTFPDGVRYAEYRIGGTSLSSPLYAGMFALVVQKAGHRFGLANPALYRAKSATLDITKAQRATYPGVVRSDYANFLDASEGYVYSARWFDYDEPLTIHVRSGYDDVTGIGSPKGSGWLSAVAAG